MINFENPEVAAKYEALRSTDGKVHIPGGHKIPGQERTGFMGPLSKITLAAADKAFASGSNILKLKEVSKSGKPFLPVEKKEEKPV